jgi:deoxyribonuclease-1
MQADMHNLFPAVGELNGDRKNFRFDFTLAKPKQYGECKFSVDFKAKRARIKEDIRGIIARDYLYFNKQYGMRLSKQEMKKYKAWNKQYPADDWEIERNKRIGKIQGNLNEYIDKVK